MKTKILALFCMGAMSAAAAHYEVSSPNGKVSVTVETDQQVCWSVRYDGKTVLMPSRIDIQTQQGKKSLGLGRVGKVARHRIDTSFETPFYKKQSVSDAYGQLLLYTSQQFTIEVRAYDDGAAYRLISTNAKPLNVVGETAGSALPTTTRPSCPMSTTTAVASVTAIPLSRITTNSDCRRCSPTR